jgi:hypothetical protein
MRLSWIRVARSRDSETVFSVLKRFSIFLHIVQRCDLNLPGAGVTVRVVRPIAEPRAREATGRSMQPSRQKRAVAKAWAKVVASRGEFAK